MQIAPSDPTTFRVDRDDVATASLAPVTLIASSGSLTAAFSTREQGPRPDTAASITSDGRTWHEITSPWRDDPPPSDPSNAPIRAPVSLAYGSGRFLALGYRAELDGNRYRAHTVLADSTDGVRWDLHDIAAVPVGDFPTLLVQHAGEWLMVADGADDHRSRLYRSPDGLSWTADRPFGFRVSSLTSTPFGLVAVGGRSDSPSENVTIVEVSRDTRTWQESTGWQPYRSSSVAGVMRTPGGLTVVAIEPAPTGPVSAWRTRLLHTEDGSTWTTAPTPACLVPYSGIGAVGSTAAGMAVATSSDPPVLAISRSGGATWSCTPLDGDAFQPKVRASGSATINGIADIDGNLTLFGGRAAPPGAKTNWNGAVWTATETGTGLDRATATVHSRLGYTIRVPNRWRQVDDVDASDALAGPSSSGLFRVRVYDRPDRTSFIDAVESGPLPNLAQASAQLARAFPNEFGTAPTVTATTLGGRPARRIAPSPDASTPESVTYLVEFVGGSSRFIEITVDADHDAAIVRTLRWDTP